MLDPSIINQLKSIFADINGSYLLDAYVESNHPSGEELAEFLSGFASASEHLSYRIQEGEGLHFNIVRNGTPTGIKFRGIPNGHEFTSLLLAILNSDGKGKNLPDAFIAGRIKALKGPICLSTYVSLTCTNCPDVVQTLNIMSILNSGISHEMVDGGMFEEEVEALKIQAVPTVYAGGDILHVGRGELGILLDKLEQKYGSDPAANRAEVKEYDVVVVGAGPAGSAAAIYSARKGLKVALLAERMGGQVKETVGIENLIATPETTGEQLATNLKSHIAHYPIDLLEHRTVEKIETEGDRKLITVRGGETFVTQSLIIATGASWRKLNVEGEARYTGHGVAYCPHCDGPFYKGKHVAVVGGGNSGIEAAIDLAGICRKVTVFEFLENLKADEVLQKKAQSLPNIEIFLNRQTTEVAGDGEKVTGLKVRDRATGEERMVELDGVFVQIGLTANSSIVKDLVTVNRFGEIEIDTHCRTSEKGIYAAGDVTTVPYKQIIIAMGEGAKAALSAFEDRIRGN